MTNEARFYAQAILSCGLLILFNQTENMWLVTLFVMCGCGAIYNLVAAAHKAWQELPE